MNIRQKITGIIVCAVIVAGVWNVYAESEARRKARYFYTAGIREQAAGNQDRAYEYFKKSYLSDPSYPEGSMAFGNRRLYVGIDSLQTPDELERSLSLMKAYIDRYPDDVYEATNYGFIAGQLGQTEEAVRVLERTYSLHPDKSNILLELSDVHARAYDLPAAVEAIDRYELHEGFSVPVTTRKLSYLLAAGDTIKAVSEVSKLLDSNPGDVSFTILKGNVYDIIEKPDSAFAYYSRAEALDPESGAAKLALAGYYLQQEDSVNYDNKMYEVLLAEDFVLSQKAELVAQYLDHLMRSASNTARGDYLFSVLKSQYPHEPQVLDLAARYSAAKGDFKDAVDQISYAIDLQPDNSKYWGQLLTYQSAAGEPKEALISYEKAKNYIVPDRQLKLFYATVAQMAEDYEKAEAVYKEMIREIQPGLNPDTLLSLNDVKKDISMRELDLLSSLFTSLGDVYNQEGKREDSYQAYENAITMNSSNSMAKNNYAYFLSINGGDLDKAAALSEESMVGEDTENPTYLDTYAWINYLKGDYEKAEEYQLKAIEIIKESKYDAAEIYNHLGDIMAARSKMKEALEAWKKAAEIYEKTEETSDSEYEKLINKIKETEANNQDL